MRFLNLARSVHQAISIYTDTIDAAKVIHGDGLIKDGLKDSLKDGLKDGLMKDRFRGAVVGLWMVPTALSSASSLSSASYDISYPHSSDDVGRSYSGRSYSGRSYREERSCDWLVGTEDSVDNQEAIASMIARHLDALNTFLGSPLPSRSPATYSRCTLSSLPLLLRYHSDAKRRAHALLESVVKQEPKQAAQRLAQQLILGDVLSMAFGMTDLQASASLPSAFLASSSLIEPFNLGKPRQSLAATAMSEIDASNYGLSSLQYRCYRDLWQSLEECVLQGTTASNSVIEGIAIALSQPNHYPAAVQNAWSHIQSTHIDRGAFASSPIESVIVTSVVCGALGGRQSLPVLWQLQTDADQTQANSRSENDSERSGSRPLMWQLQSAVELADCLFAQWAGQWTGQWAGQRTDQRAGITPRASHYNT